MKERKKKRKKGRKEEKENENWLKIENIEIWRRIATTFKTPNLKIINFSWKQIALRGQTA